MTDEQRASLIALAERCEAATEGSLDLDNAIRDVAGEGRELGSAPTPYYTTSIDAALTLVPEGVYEQGIWWPDPKCELVLKSETVSGEADTIALAICAAALRARAAQ
jgi:hypothetical protein